MSVILVCDKCKKQEAEDKKSNMNILGRPEGWVQLTITVQSPVYCNKSLLLCDKCIVSTGLGEVVDDKLKSTNPTADALYDVVAEIVQNEMEAYEP